MQRSAPVLVRLANAVIIGGLAGWLLVVLGKPLHYAVTGGLASAGVVYACTTALKGQRVLAKVDAAFAAVTLLFASAGHGITTAIDGNGSWTAGWPFNIFAVLILLMIPAVSARLGLSKQGTA